MGASYNTEHGTLVNCIDGTVQLPAIDFVKKMWNVPWVDVITEVAPERAFSDATSKAEVDHILNNIKSSLVNQQRKRLAIVSHSSCDVYKVSDEKKIEMLHLAVNFLSQSFPDASVTGIWIDKKGALRSLSRAC